VSRLDSIITGKVIEPARILIYGDQGVGKSTFAASAPKPIFVVTEKGANNIDVPKFPRANTWRDFKGNLEDLCYEKHEYQSVVIDCLDWAEKLVHAEVCAQHGVTDIGVIPYGRGKVASLTYWSELISLLDTLQEKRRMGVICVAHSKIERFEAPDTDSYERYSLDIYEKAASLMKQWADCILFATFKKYVAQKTGDFGRTTNKAYGTGERMLYTEERPAFLAKNRYSMPAELPLDWATVFGHIKKSTGMRTRKEKPEGEKQEVETPEETQPPERPINTTPTNFDDDNLPENFGDLSNAAA
jgi:hypothetical protein